MDKVAQRRTAAAARSGAYLAVALVALALAACTRTYYKDFAVEPQDRAYAARAQFEDIKRYLIARGLRTVMETRDLFVVQVEREDSLQVRLLANQKVELTLVRRSSGEDFTRDELNRFRESMQRLLRERTGQGVTIRLVGERTTPITNIQ